MAALAPQSARRLALLSSLAAGLLVLAALYAALGTPPSLDFTTARVATGQRVVTWVAPDGPAWNAGVRPGSLVMATHAPDGRGGAGLLVDAGGRRVVVSAASLAATPLDLLVSGLGLGLVVLGALVLVKSADRTASAAFWRLSLLAGTTMSVVPAGFHGAPWALALTFGTLYAVGPALWELACVFPRPERPGAPGARGAALLPGCRSWCSCCCIRSAGCSLSRCCRWCSWPATACWREASWRPAAGSSACSVGP